MGITEEKDKGLIWRERKREKLALAFHGGKNAPVCLVTREMVDYGERRTCEEW